MATNRVEDIRNVAICGHGSAGKTTIVDQMLATVGKVSDTPSVDDGTSICDFDPEEKAHHHTIESSVVHFEHQGKNFNVIDTPGYPDFIGQTIGALQAVDTACIVVNAHSGIEVNTRRVFDEAGEAGIGRIIVINRLDTDNIDFQDVVDNIREVWGNQCVLLNVPIGLGDTFKGVISTLRPPADTAGAVVDPAEINGPLLESIIEVDDEVMERYFEGKQPTEEELSRLIVRAVAEGTLIPIACCAGKPNIGVTELIEALVLCGLAPSDVNRTAIKEGETFELSPDPAGPLAAQVFKTRIDPFVQKLSFIRIFSGTLKKDDHLAASTARKEIKMGPLFSVQGEATEPVDEAGPGAIVAVAKMEELATGTSLGEYTLPRIPFPTPMVGLAVSPKTRGDETKLSGALHKVVEEDSTFVLDRDSQTKELVITGMSDLHLKIIRERLARRDKLEIDTAEPKIPYRETIQGSADEFYRHKKQSGGRGQFGEVHIRMMPFPRGTDPAEFCSKARFPSMKTYHHDETHNFLWVDSVVGGVIPHNFIPAIEKGFKERLDTGVIAGCRVQNVCVEVHFGKHHPVDSSEAAFRTAGRMVFRNAFLNSSPCLLEPVVALDITVSEEHVGDVYSHMSGHGGQVKGSETAGGSLQTIHAEAPLREVTTFARTLSSMTGGEGSYSMHFSHYAIVPGNVQREIMAHFKEEEEEDDA